jgi:molybdenum-dependent DNA-binding transcriptional regulator ModE
MAGESSGGFWSGRRLDRADCRDMINSQQRIRLVTEFQRTGSIGMSALKSGMDRKTARKYLKHLERMGEP